MRPIKFKKKEISDILNNKKTMFPILVENDDLQNYSLYHYKINKLTKYLILCFRKGYFEHGSFIETTYNVKVPYQIGEILYIQEPFASLSQKIVYKYNITKEEHALLQKHNCYWTSSKQMTKDEARCFIQIEYINIKQLSELDLNDCIKAGWKDKEEFLIYWDKNYKYTNFKIQNNPWIWIIEFKKIKGREKNIMKKERQDS